MNKIKKKRGGRHHTIVSKSTGACRNPQLGDTVFCHTDNHARNQPRKHKEKDADDDPWVLGNLIHPPTHIYYSVSSANSSWRHGHTHTTTHSGMHESAYTHTTTHRYDAVRTFFLFHFFLFQGKVIEPHAHAHHIYTYTGIIFPHIHRHACACTHTNKTKQLL